MSIRLRTESTSNYILIRVYNNWMRFVFKTKIETNPTGSRPRPPPITRNNVITPSVVLWCYADHRPSEPCRPISRVLCGHGPRTLVKFPKDIGLKNIRIWNYVRTRTGRTWDVNSSFIAFGQTYIYTHIYIKFKSTVRWKKNIQRVALRYAFLRDVRQILFIFRFYVLTRFYTSSCSDGFTRMEISRFPKIFLYRYNITMCDVDNIKITFMYLHIVMSVKTAAYGLR